MKSKPASLRDFASAPEQPPAPAKPPTVKRQPGGMGRTKVVKTGTMKKKAFK